MISISLSRMRDQRSGWLHENVAGNGAKQNPPVSDLQRANYELRGMAAVAFLVAYSNSMIAPLIPAVAREFGVRPVDFKWLVPGSIIYGTATLFYGILSDRFGRYPLLKVQLILAAMTVFALSLVITSRQLVLFRCFTAASTGGIAAIALCIIGDRYPYVAQGRPMGNMFGAIATGIGFGSSLGPLLNPMLGWRNELRILSFGFGVAFLWITRSVSGSFLRTSAEPLWRYALEYRCILEAPRGGRTLAFIFANGAFHGGIFAWLGVLLAGRYHLGEIGIGIVLAGYGLPDLFLGEVIGSWADRHGKTTHCAVRLLLGLDLRASARIRGNAVGIRAHNRCAIAWVWRNSSNDVEHHDIPGSETLRPDNRTRDIRQFSGSGIWRIAVSPTDGSPF